MLNLFIINNIIKFINKIKMSVEKELKNENIEENIVKRLNNTDNNLPKVKKHKKSTKKSRFANQVKVVPLLKPPNERRKYDENGNLKNQEVIRQKSGIVWDNKTIDEQYLDRVLHPRIKIDEPKTPYPDGDENDLYQEGMNKLNEIKPTEELLNEVVNSLKENDDEKKKNLKTKELKKKAYDNEYTKALKFYNENREKFEDLPLERKKSLTNTLINKFHKEVRDLSKGKKKNSVEN